MDQHINKVHTYFYVSYGREIVDYQVLLMNSFIVSETD